MSVSIDFPDSGGCRHVCISSLPGLPPQHNRLFTGIGATAVHPRLRVHENRGKAVPDTPGPYDFDLVASGVERVDHRLGEACLDLQTIRIGAMRPGRLGEARTTEARRLDCLLHVQPEVDDVGKHLQAALWLAITAGGPERH